jgi:hypothetical protein
MASILSLMPDFDDMSSVLTQQDQTPDAILIIHLRYSVSEELISLRC